MRPFLIRILLSSLFISSCAQAQLAQWEFNENLTDVVRGIEGEFLFEQQATQSEPTYVATDEETALYLAPQEAVRFPGSLTNELIANDAFTLSARFKVGAFEGEGADWGYLWSNQKSRSWCSEGFTVTWERYGDSGQARLILRYGDDCLEPFYDENIILGIVNIDEWVDLQIVVDFASKNIRALVNNVFLLRPFNSDAVLENIISGMRDNPMYLGWYAHTHWPHNPHSSGVTIDYLAIYDSAPPPDGERYRDAVVALGEYIDGARSLTLEEREAYYLDIALNSGGQYLPYRSEADAFIAAFEAANLPLFHRTYHENVDEWPPEDRAMLVIQQDIHDNAFTQGSLQALEGLKFEAADAFPGMVSAEAPRLLNQVVEIDASFNADPAVAYPEDESGAMRPTGYYVPPGELIKIEIDPDYVNAGLQAVVGVHTNDLSRKLPVIGRFPRVSKTYDLNQPSVEVANPFGGAIYIRVPPGNAHGWIPVTISGAVKAPYFRYLPGRETDLGEWQADLGSAHVPWADFESSHMMFTWPSVIGQYQPDPAGAMALWDQFWEGVAVMLGRDFSQKKTEWTVLDAQIPFGGFSAGYPVPFGSPVAPEPDFPDREYDWYISSPLAITEPDYHWATSLPEIMAHEMGHNMRWPTLGPEVETIAQMVFVGGFNAGLGLNIDEAMIHSADPDQDRDQAAMDWIMTHNFRDDVEMGCDPTMDPGVCHELRYQHRGYAKYVDIAMLFGWEGLGAANGIIYDRWLSEGGINFSFDKEFVDDDEYLLAVAEALGVNPLPLFHFWGVRGSAEVEAQLAALPNSPEIYQRLMYYRELVPLTKEDFQPWYDLNRPKVDPVHFDRYDWALANWDSEQLGHRAVEQIDRVLAAWYPSNFDAEDPNPQIIGPAHSGSWYSPGQSGHGFSMEFVTLPDGTPTAVVYWYLYDDEGNPIFMLGLGSPEGNRVELKLESPTGMAFGEWAEDSVIRHDGGTMVIEFSDRANARLSYTPSEFAQSQWGHTTIENLSIEMLFGVDAPKTFAESAPGPAPEDLSVVSPAHSGSWYSPGQSGHGFSMEFARLAGGAPTAVVYWYIYDTEGNPIFMLGLGTPEGNRVELQLESPTGMVFGDWDEDSVIRNDGGSAVIEFTDRTQARFSYTPSEFAQSQWGHTAIDDLPIVLLLGIDGAQSFGDGEE